MLQINISVLDQGYFCSQLSGRGLFIQCAGLSMTDSKRSWVAKCEQAGLGVQNGLETLGNKQITGKTTHSIHQNKGSTSLIFHWSSFRAKPVNLKYVHLSYYCRHSKGSFLKITNHSNSSSYYCRKISFSQRKYRFLTSQQLNVAGYAVLLSLGVLQNHTVVQCILNIIK